MGKSKPKPKPKPKSSAPKTASPAPSSPSQEAQNQSQSSPSPPKELESFESHYLRLCTTHFATDIDKIRSAPDFTASSIPVLIQALKQGAHSFTPEEQRMIMEAKPANSSDSGGGTS